MGENTGGGKSTQVQAPQRASAPVVTTVNGGGYVRASKKSIAKTAGEHNFFPVQPKAVRGYTARRKRYHGLDRNAPCGCGSGLKHKKCCIDKLWEGGEK